ncbi:ABC-three component system protein [Halonatronum saccharophilum]|uniref:ABC-three component system protein n=1 Tax=Halonatronum saccharophilum TaxID=150060 RepID=UPI0004878848|nr:ABC-three component system protein [Halonatronum saccharophilum]
MSTSLIKKEKNFHDATPTWNGFNYQGKVAIYILLRELNNDDIDSYNNYFLELEWLEDFSIKKRDTYISIHQVKAYNKSNFSKYKDAIFNLIKKVIDYNLEIKAYIHSWKNIDDWNEENIKDKFNKGIESLIEKLETYISNKNKLKKFINKFINKKQMTDIEKILKDEIINYSNKTEIINMKEDNNFEQIKEIIKKAINIIERKKISLYKKITKGDNFKVVMNNLKSEFHEIEDINNSIKKEIEIYYKKQGEDHKINAFNIERVFENFLGKIDEHIIQRHKNFQQDEKLVIPFLEIKNILEEDLEQPSKKYFLYHLKNVFNDTRNKYCNFYCQRVKVQGDCNNCILKLLIKKINSLDYYQFELLCKNISPDVNAEVIDMKVYKILMSEDGLLQSFLTCFERISLEYLWDKHKPIYHYESNTGIDTYLPTTLRSKGSEELVITQIFTNPHFLEELYEVDNMISNDININSLIEEYAKIKNTQIFLKKEQGIGSKITEIGNMSIIGVEKAIEELSDNE